jgi:hypothetical protein
MFEGMLGRLVNGALWGVGAGVAMSLVRGGPGMRPVAKALIKAYVAATDRVQEMTAEARESLDDLYAEARAEQAAETERAPDRPVQRIAVDRTRRDAES